MCQAYIRISGNQADVKHKDILFQEFYLSLGDSVTLDKALVLIEVVYCILC